MRVLFLHGLEGHPDGSKVRALRAQGFDVTAPDFRPVLRAPVDLRRSLAACADLVALDPRPDVIVASSWGGAVAGELIRRGRWDGPTVLLAPAIGFVDEDGAITRAVRAAHGPVVVFHDPADDTIPLGHSVGMAEGFPRVLRRGPRASLLVLNGEVEYPREARLSGKGSPIALRVVSAGGHRLMGLLDSGELAEVLRGLVSDG